MRQAASDLYAAVDGDPAHFAGIYSTDEGGRWRIVVLFLGDEPPASVVTTVPADVPVEWLKADYSESQLLSVRARVLAFWQANDPDRSQVESIALDTVNNRIRVEFADKDSPELRSKMAAEFGPIVTFTVVPRATSI